MTTFTRTWDATYQSLPEDDDDALEGAARIRHTRVDVKERMEVDHHWAGDAHDGKHKKITLRPLIADPALDGDEIALYGKAIGSATELFYKAESGAIQQLTFTTGAPQAVPPGAVIASASSVIPDGFLECDGSAVSRVTFAALFAAIGTTFGAGNGTTTFNLPDAKGRTVFGKETAQSRITTAVSGVNGGTLGAVGGSQSLHGHDHTASVVDPGHTHPVSAVMLGATYNVRIEGGANWVQSGGTTGSGTTGISVNVNNSGSGSSQNIPPAIIMRWIIKT